MYTTPSVNPFLVLSAQQGSSRALGVSELTFVADPQSRVYLNSPYFKDEETEAGEEFPSFTLGPAIPPGVWTADAHGILGVSSTSLALDLPICEEQAQQCHLQSPRGSMPRQ